MKKSDLLNLKSLIIFTKKEVSNLDNDISSASIDDNISRWINNGTLIQLKNGYYTHSDTHSEFKNDFKFSVFVANSLRYPSYVTADTILRYYDILSESTFGVISFTTKIPKEYKNKLNNFSFKKIKDEYFVGYYIDYFLDRKIYIATKAKALFDFLYIKSPTLPDNVSNLNLIEEFRLNLEIFTESDWKELKSYAGIRPESKISSLVINMIENASFG